MITLLLKAAGDAQQVALCCILIALLAGQFQSLRWCVNDLGLQINPCAAGG